MMRLFLILLVSAFLSDRTAAREYSGDISSWIVTTQPDKGSKEFETFLHDAYFSRTSWKLSMDGEKVIASTRATGSAASSSEKPAFDTELIVELKSDDGKGHAEIIHRTKADPKWIRKVDDGWLAAYNRGEFGAAIYWFSVDGKTRRKLSDHWLNDAVQEGDRFIAATGLNHMGRAQGAIIGISKGEKGWRVDEFLQLTQSAERLCQLADRDYLVVTSGYPTSQLLRVDLRKAPIALIDDFPWGPYANSVVVANGQIYIGTAGYVVRCPLATTPQSYDLLIPDESWKPKAME